MAILPSSCCQSGIRAGFLPAPETFQELLEALTSPKEDAIEMDTVKAEVGADALFFLLGDVEAEQDLAVAVGRELVDEPPHALGLLVPQDVGELARRGVDRLRQLLVVHVGPAAGGLAPLGDDQVARGAAEEAGERGRLVERSPPQALQRDAEGLLVQILGEIRRGAQTAQQIEDAPAVAQDERLLGGGIARRDPPDKVGGNLRLAGLESRIRPHGAHRASDRPCRKSSEEIPYHTSGSAELALARRATWDLLKESPSRTRRPRDRMRDSPWERTASRRSPPAPPEPSRKSPGPRRTWFARSHGLGRGTRNCWQLRCSRPAYPAHPEYLE